MAFKWHYLFVQCGTEERTSLSVFLVRRTNVVFVHRGDLSSTVVQEQEMQGQIGKGGASNRQEV
jgi:hypothetical protein